VVTSLAETGTQVPALQAQLADRTEQLARAERKVEEATQEVTRVRGQLDTLSSRVQETTSESFRQLKDEIQRKDNQVCACDRAGWRVERAQTVDSQGVDRQSGK
jgi:chromosome segregation ATPase